MSYISSFEFYQLVNKFAFILTSTYSFQHGVRETCTSHFKMRNPSSKLRITITYVRRTFMSLLYKTSSYLPKSHSSTHKIEPTFLVWQFLKMIKETSTSLVIGENDKFKFVTPERQGHIIKGICMVIAKFPKLCTYCSYKIKP